MNIYQIMQLIVLKYFYKFSHQYIQMYKFITSEFIILACQYTSVNKKNYIYNLSKQIYQMGVCQGSTQQKNQLTKKPKLPPGGQRQRQRVQESNFVEFLAQRIRDRKNENLETQQTLKIEEISVQ
ncbi:hypothetical protein pb186bvf_003879 [Paramecium bursaria]